MNFLFKMLSEHAIPAMFSTFGVFTLTFFVMVGHYRLRRSFYKKLLPSLENSIQNRKGRYEEYKRRMENEEIKRIYEKYGLEIREEQERRMYEYESDVWKMENDANYIKHYSFKRYIIDLLNYRFPEAYWNGKK